jgi:choline transporter-like protein 2/4/5
MAMIEVIFFPILTFLLQLLVFVACVAVGMCLMSLQRAEKASINGTITFNISDKLQIMHCADAQEGNNTFDEWKRKFCSPTIPYGWLRYFQFFVLFMYFWLFNFIMGLSQMAIAGCYVDWYFTRDKSIRLPGRTLLSAVWRTLRYHTGSVAFGSLIIAIVQTARAILDYIDEQFRASQSDIAQFIMKCCKCCLWCLEKVLKFITKNAYIMVAIRGQNFCSSAREAFFLLTRNIIRVVVLSSISSFLMFIGKLFIVGVTVVLAFFLLEKGIPLPTSIQNSIKNDTNHSMFIDKLVPDAFFSGQPLIHMNNPHFWLAIIVIGTFVIAACFFTVFEMGVDTLFLCFCEDLEMNDGSAERPYFMTKSLMDILSKRNEPTPQPAEKKEGGEEAIELKKAEA